jgi:tetratricopeptide (TPR) repeat protein
VLVLSLLVPGEAFSVNGDSLFTEANTAYQNQDFNKALELYKELENNELRSAALYYNMGNCYFKTGELGYAILYYMRARRLDPFDADINSNLEFTRQFIPSRLEGIKINPITSFFDLLVEPLTLNSFAWISSMLFVGLMLLVSASLVWRWRGTIFKIMVGILIVGVFASAGLTTYKYRTDYLTRRGVIVADEARIYSGPGEDNDLEFVGNFGLTFEIEKASNDYYLVLFENKRKGWIKKEMIEVI